MRYKNELGSSASKTRFVSQKVLHSRGRCGTGNWEWEKANSQPGEAAFRSGRQAHDRDRRDRADGPPGWLAPSAKVPNGSHQWGWRGPRRSGPPDRLLREVSNRRPREALSRLEVPARPSPAAQGRSGNSSAELSQPPASPLETRPPHTNSTSNRGPNSSPAASSWHAESALRDQTYAPQAGCAAGVRRARRWGLAEPASLRVCPGTQPPDHLRLAPSPGTARLGFDPPIPRGRGLGEDPSKPSPPAPALTHLFASPCRRARRCRVPLCTLRTQTNPPPAPAPPPASPWNHNPLSAFPIEAPGRGGRRRSVPPPPPPPPATAAPLLQQPPLGRARAPPAAPRFAFSKGLLGGRCSHLLHLLLLRGGGGGGSSRWQPQSRLPPSFPCFGTWWAAPRLPRAH